MSGIRYAKSGDVSIAYHVLGDGPLDLVLVPGFVSNTEVMLESPPTRRWLERLAEFSRLILWDKRDQGQSDRLGRPPTLEQSMDDLHAVLDAAGSERAALFGISEGGPMSLLFAASHPERVSALVLLGSYARLSRAPDYPMGVPDYALRNFIDRAEEQWGEPVLLDVFAPGYSADPQAQAAWSRVLRMGSSPLGARNLLEMYVELDVRAVLPVIAVPTLVAHRTGDRIALVEHGRYIAEHVPGARLFELPGDDHLPFFDEDDRILGEIEEFLTGQRQLREPDRVLATVLFTDIVDSTRQAAQMGDQRWRGLLERHDDIVRREVERFRGRLVKHTGDGALATFDGPARGIRAACSIRGAVRDLGVEVRAGVHAGECEVMGEDLGGLAVHIGARVGSEAAPGEVLVSGTVRDLVVGSDLEFEDRGSHALKGVPGEWRLYAVRG